MHYGYTPWLVTVREDNMFIPTFQRRGDFSRGQIRNVRMFSNQDFTVPVEKLESGSRGNGVLEGVTDLHNSQ